MKILISATAALLTVGCSEQSDSAIMPSVPSVNLGPGLGGSAVTSSGVSYLLACKDGTISINANWPKIEGIETERDRWTSREQVDTGVDRLTCTLDEGSFEVNESPGRLTGFASAGDWICEGLELRFTMGGHLASTPAGSATQYHLTKTAPLKWQLSDTSPCLFIVD